MAQTTGTLDKVSSTVSSPTVNYSATYTATRSNNSTTAVSVALTFSAWLNSGGFLGTGHKLTIYVRLNGGAWQNVQIKSKDASWRGTTKHTASVTLTGNVKSNKTKIDFYVTREGSTESGSAGKLGSASKPKSYTATLPTYKDDGGDTPTPTPATDKYIYIRVNGAWKQAVPYVKVSGLWKQATAYVKTGGAWKST